MQRKRAKALGDFAAASQTFLRTKMEGPSSRVCEVLHFLNAVRSPDVKPHVLVLGIDDYVEFESVKDPVNIARSATVTCMISSIAKPYAVPLDPLRASPGQALYEPLQGPAFDACSAWLATRLPVLLMMPYDAMFGDMVACFNVKETPAHLSATANHVAEHRLPV